MVVVVVVVVVVLRAAAEFQHLDMISKFSCAFSLFFRTSPPQPTLPFFRMELGNGSQVPPPSPRAAPESQRVVRNARATAPGAQWLCASAVSQTTARGFEPLRAEPNGFRVHHLNHSVTLSYRVSWHTLQTSKIASHLCCYQLTTNKTSLLSTLQGLLGSAAEEQCCQSFAMSEGHFWEVKLDIVFVCHAFKNHVQLGTWCSGITPAQHAGGPGLNPQCVHLLHGTTLWRRQNKPHTKH